MTPATAQKSLATAVAAACVLASPLILKWEGMRTVGYRDIAGVATDCAGHTAGAVVGQRYTTAQCMAFFQEDELEHGEAIDRCITVPIPPVSRAAFTSFAFNAGAPAFCASTMAKKLNAGDLAGACAQLSLWTHAGGKVVPGLAARRAEERAYCEQGLRSPK